jgi:hypothetical protein
VLALPEGERLDIVAEILARLDGPADPDWEAAWLAELEARSPRSRLSPARGQAKLSPCRGRCRR